MKICDRVEKWFYKHRTKGDQEKLKSLKDKKQVSIKWKVLITFKNRELFKMNWSGARDWLMKNSELVLNNKQKNTCV